MARSIHDTRGVMERAERADWSDAHIPIAIVDEMKGNIRRQRAVRESERRLRRPGATFVPPVHPDQVPILVDEQAPCIFHPASEEDIRAVLRRLPPGSFDGLQAIRLCVDHTEGDAAWPRDPFIGGRRQELIPGVYASNSLGSYSRSRATIRLHAYLCDPATIAPFALFFKLRTLKVLLHELGHHFDLTFRVGRSRWDVEDREKEEAWALQSENEPAADLLGPYIRERYSSECDALEQWMADHGGATFSVNGFLLDERRWPLHRAFFTLARSVLAGHERDATRVAFARKLRDSGAWEPAEEIVRGVLANRPDDAEALAMSALLAMRKGRRDFETAESLCRRAIASDPTCLYAWQGLVRCLWMQEEWERTALACEEALSFIPVGDIQFGEGILVALVESRLLLGDFCKAASDVERMRAWGTRSCTASADVYGAITRCWAGEWEDALVLSSRLLKSDWYKGWGALLPAVRFECAHRLGRPHLAGAFGKAELAELEGRAFTKKWARRIREHIDRNGP